MAEIGREFASTLCPGDVVALYGDLGAGKTTFVQGVLEGFGIKDRSGSPTFVIVNEYKTPSKKFGKNISIYHMDLYRIDKSEQIDDLGLSDVFVDDSISFIEWAQKFPEILPVNAKKVYIEHVSENERTIEIQ